MSDFRRPETSQLLLLATALAAAGYERAAVGPLQETMSRALALTDNQAALLQGPALAVPMLILAVPLGILIDHGPRARLVVLFCALNIAAGVMTATASRFGSLFMARCLAGVVASAISVSVLSLLADIFAPGFRGRATMVLAIGEVGGASAAFALGGALLVAGPVAADGWHWAMLCLTAPLGLSLLLAMLIREPLKGATPAGRGMSIPEMGRNLWRSRALMTPLVVGKVTVGIAYGAVLVWTAPTLARRFALAPNRIGAIMAAALLISGVLGPIAGGYMADFCQRSGGPRRTVVALACLALVSAPLGLFALMPSVTLASVCLALFLMTTSVIGVTEQTLSTIVLPTRIRALCLSVLVTAGLVLGMGSAPLAVSLLSVVLGGAAGIGRALAAVCAATGIVSATAFALGRRYFPCAAIS